MKKQSLKSLALNKKSISNLRKDTVNGGHHNDPRTGGNCHNDSTIHNCPHTCIYSISQCETIFGC